MWQFGLNLSFPCVKWDLSALHHLVVCFHWTCCSLIWEYGKLPEFSSDCCYRDAGRVASVSSLGQRHILKENKHCKQAPLNRCSLQCRTGWVQALPCPPSQSCPCVWYSHCSCHPFSQFSCRVLCTLACCLNVSLLPSPEPAKIWAMSLSACPEHTEALRCSIPVAGRHQQAAQWGNLPLDGWTSFLSSSLSVLFPAKWPCLAQNNGLVVSSLAAHFIA